MNFVPVGKNLRDLAVGHGLSERDGQKNLPDFLPELGSHHAERRCEIRLFSAEINIKPKIRPAENVKILFFVLALTGISITANAQLPKKRTSGNPILPEFHADPEIIYSHQTNRFYIYSTTDGAPGWGGYYFTAFSRTLLLSFSTSLPGLAKPTPRLGERGR